MKSIRIGEVGIDAATQETSDVLMCGGVVLFPTDTLYGLAVDARNTEAVAKLITLKGRDAAKAISVVLPSVESISKYAEVSETTQKLIDTYLPGPLTLVLPIKGDELHHLAPDGTIGIRVPNDSFTLALGRAFGAPYTATSANVSGRPSQSTVSEIIEQFGTSAEQIDLVIDDGPRAGGIPSTVVRVTGSDIEILREGAIPAKEIERHLV